MLVRPWPCTSDQRPVTALLVVFSAHRGIPGAIFSSIGAISTARISTPCVELSPAIAEKPGAVSERRCGDRRLRPDRTKTSGGPGSARLVACADVDQSRARA